MHQFSNLCICIALNREPSMTVLQDKEPNMAERTDARRDTRQCVRRAARMRRRLLGRWLARCLRRLWSGLAAARAEAELRALDARELHDLGLDRGSIAYAARHGRVRQPR